MSAFRHAARNLLLVAGLLFALPGTSLAQQVYGSIFGTVTDPTGSAVPNAKVTITDESKGTKSEVTTNESGNYTKGQLIPGTYTVTVEAPGFQRSEFRNIQVQVDNAARVDATLQVGNSSETVEVTAQAPTLQADRADVQTTFTSRQLIDLPSLGRNAQAYELLAPGVSRIGFAHASSEDPQGSVQAEVNGQHFSGTGFQLDGTENQDPILGIIVINPNIDSLSETKIAAQDYDAEFGYAGAGIQNSSTRSGTNQMHGTAFEYFRNNSRGFSDFGRDPFSDTSGMAPILRWNQFGGSIGGKIIKDKLFFFGDAELVRQRFGGSVLTTVPTAAARTGDFSAYLASSAQNAIFDPATGNPATGVGRTQFPGNIIPQNRLSPQALAIINYFPLPNVASSTPFNNYAGSGGGSFDANKWDTREDYFMTEKTSIFGRYSNHQFARSAVGAFGSLAGGPAFNNVSFAGNSFVRNQSIAIGLTHSFNPTLISDFRFGYVKYNVNTTPNGFGTQPATAAGIPGLNLDTTFTSGLPYFNFVDPNNTQITSLGYSLGANQCNCPLTEAEGQYQFTGNVTKVLGNHSLKFGADIRYAKNLRIPSDSHRAGELTFNTQNTGVVNSVGGSAVDGLGFATFLLGDVTGFARYVSTSTNASERQRRWFFYGQDSYRLTPKLTVNWGLRWELVFPETVNARGNGAQLDLSTGLINVFGIGGVSMHGIQRMNYLNFAPRLGIAYQLNEKTVIRTGYGWSYELGTFGATFGHNVTQNPPVLFNQQPSSPNGQAFQTVFTLAQGPPTPTGFTVPSSGQFILPDGVGAKARSADVRLPRVEAYNLTVERQIIKDTSLSVGYVGNVGRHVGPGSGDGFNYNVNQAAFVPGVADANTLKPFYNKIGANGQPLLWTQGIDLYCQCLTNEYNSLQVQLKRTFSAGYGVQASYTWQDAVSDNSDAYTILYNRPLGRGRENAIPDHELTIAQNYDIPFGKGRRYGKSLNPYVDYALGGWSLSGVTVFYSGLPFSPNINVYPPGVIRPNQGPGNRPDKGTGSPYASNQNRDHWLNVNPDGSLSSAFKIPANNTYGNYGFNTLRGPIFINQDLSVAKNFALTEQFRLQLRGEFYNLFNHTNLGPVNGNVNGNNAGNITSIAFGSTMRRLQFALRLEF
ncbi:MAG: Outer rane receptor for ferrienterochelin and colicin [Bryobacterales bacterium]|nr:Outer rane receptor for ferrienterochelin and colicin [Bryobacterales bacterium]